MKDKYVVGLGEALWDVLPMVENWAAPQPISPIMPASLG